MIRNNRSKFTPHPNDNVINVLKLNLGYWPGEIILEFEFNLPIITYSSCFQKKNPQHCFENCIYFQTCIDENKSEASTKMKTNANSHANFNFIENNSLVKIRFSDFEKWR